MTSFAVNALVEGMIDEAIVRRILDYVELPCGQVYVQIRECAFVLLFVL